MRIKWFVIGSISTILILLLLPYAFASFSGGSMTITIDPIKIQVDGNEFRPKDINGNEVLVFAYNGTTYAPLRALAEAYGLYVGYDAILNVATVDKEKQTVKEELSISQNYTFEYSYDEFKSLWDGPFEDESGNCLCAKNNDVISAWMNGVDDKTKEEMFARYTRELYNTVADTHYPVEYIYEHNGKRFFVVTAITVNGDGYVITGLGEPIIKTD